jgi:hypothetical protein
MTPDLRTHGGVRYADPTDSVREDAGIFLGFVSMAPTL